VPLCAWSMRFSLAEKVFAMRTTCFALTMALTFTMPASAQAAKVRVLHNFGSSLDGNVPSGPLFIDDRGNLYGTTGGGPGQYAYGIAFELTPRANGSVHETILHKFASVDGSPWGAFIADGAGNLYGTTVGGPVSNSEVYELSPGSNGWDFSVLYSQGAGPGLLMDGLGNLYGSMGPGNSQLGAIGELSPSSSDWAYTQLYSICDQYSCPGGFDPLAPPIWDSEGNLWGTMFQGGIGRPACSNDTEGCGSIYAMTPNSDGTWTYHVIHRFASSPIDGQFPDAGLTLDPAGNFYGDTEGGGTHNLGIIFKFSVAEGKVTGGAIYNFSSCLTGCYPEGTLAIDKAGNLYGMAQGGANSCGGLSCGVVYKLAPQSNGTWKYSVLVNLSETTGGVLPFYGLILDSSGNLYGVTSSFGKYGGGTAFEITP
jgi:uncharacterized repeat protein (TIGR03803 family)